MTKVITKVDGEDFSYYFDDTMYKQLMEFVRPSVTKKDFDYLLIVDGEEGSGKSVFAMQIAKVLDPNLDLKNIVFGPDEFVHAITHSKKYQCIVFDEAFTGLSSRAALSEVNKLLVGTMMEMRQRNLFVIIVMPSVFMLERYVALHRAKCLFHVYLNKEGKRGWWCFFNKQRLKYLYLKGKKFMDHNAQKAMRWGRFHERYTINEQKYREKKKAALRFKGADTKSSRFKDQRDLLFYILWKEAWFKQVEIVDLCQEYKIGIKATQLSDIVNSIRKKRDKNA